MRNDQPQPSAVRVLVADDSGIYTELLAQALSKDRRIRVVEVSANGPGVLKGVLQSNPDVLLISENLDHHPTGGLGILSEVRSNRPHLKAIILLNSPTQENVVRAFQAGARGVFCHSQPLKMLCKCISVVNEGQIWASRQELDFLLEALAATPSRPARAPGMSGLSERERDVVGCLAQGLSNRQIAERLAISQHTVKNYMLRIFEKLGVSSRVELLFFVRSRNGDVQDMLNRPAGNSPGDGTSKSAASPGQPSSRKTSTSISYGSVPRQDDPELPASSSEITGLWSA